MKKKEINTTPFNCALCANGKPDMQQINLDIEGKPLLVICRHSERKRLRIEKPCSHFIPKEV